MFKTLPGDVIEDADKVLLPTKYGDDATDEFCIPVTVVEAVVVCSLILGDPVPDASCLLDLLLSNGILL